MLRSAAICCLALGAAVLGWAGRTPTSLRLPRLFSPGMVLQRNKPVSIWGWTAPGRSVTVTLRTQSVSAVAGSDGKWTAVLEPLTAGGPDVLGVFDAGDKFLIPNVMVGDVWLCSGQSNMAFPVSQVKDSTREIESANYPQVRMFKVPFLATDEAVSDLVSGEWQAVSPETVGSFSAVAYFFGRRIHGEEQVPIGLIDASWGGSAAEAWTPRSSLSTDFELRPILSRYDRARGENRMKLAEYRRQMGKRHSPYQVDSGNQGFSMGWSSARFNDADWRTMEVPGAWEDQTADLQIDGAVWLRRTIELPADMTGKTAVLELGQIADYDTVYWNGVPVGMTPPGAPEPAGLVRHYTVHSRLMLPGRNVIAVRIFNRAGRGGFLSNPENLRLRPETGPSAISLAGPWRLKVEKSLDPNLIKPLEIPFGPGHPKAPANLFNGMVAPLVPYGLQGFLWYQGESNVERARQYQTILMRLIQGWRAMFDQGELPFIYAQLPNYRSRSPQPADAEWAELREAQRLAQRIPKTGMAVTIDLGDPNDIHPRNKQDVAERLAKAALQVAYHKTTRGLSPNFDTAKPEPSGSLRLFFSRTAGALATSDGGPPRGFAVAGTDRKFVWAQARIEGDNVIVSATGVTEPKAVRYAWDDNPDCNVISRAGLPVAPFRTDDWPLLSENRF